MKKPVPRRSPTQLEDQLENKLRAYAIAASVAGVSLLACASPAEAKIIYTKTWIEIYKAKGIGLDLNHDGKADFHFSDSSTYSGHEYIARLVVAPDGQNMVVGTSKFASALISGAVIGPKKTFQTKQLIMANSTSICLSSCNYRSYGPWKNETRHYLGLKFLIQGQVHYGWTRMNVVTGWPIHAAITGYAYETVANKPIVAGKTKGDTDRNGATAGLRSNNSARNHSLGSLASGMSLTSGMRIPSAR